MGKDVNEIMECGYAGVGCKCFSENLPSLIITMNVYETLYARHCAKHIK